jgi:chemotaxis signal transduction protein
MVFGMCATRVIGFVVSFVKDIVALRKQAVQNVPATSGARVEEVASVREKKEL